MKSTDFAVVMEKRPIINGLTTPTTCVLSTRIKAIIIWRILIERANPSAEEPDCCMCNYSDLMLGWLYTERGCNVHY